MKRRGLFVMLDITKQVECLMQIQKAFGRMKTIDLQCVNGGGTAGKSRLSSSLSNWKKSYSSVHIIDTSASGLFEQASVNLLEFL